MKKNIRSLISVLALFSALVPGASAYAHEHLENVSVILATTTEADVTLNYYDTNDGTMKFALGKRTGDSDCTTLVTTTDKTYLSPEFATPKTDGTTPYKLSYEFKNLKPGKYCAGWYESKGQTTKLGVNNFYDFSYGTNEALRNFEIISYSTNKETYAFNYANVTGTTKPGVEVKITITKPTDGAEYQMVLGTSTDSTNKCLQDPALKGTEHFVYQGTVQAEGGVNKAELSSDGQTYWIKDWWNAAYKNNLGPGKYCVGLNKKRIEGDWVTTPSMWNMGSFVIPDTAVIDPTGGGTTDTTPKPNAYGCVANGTESYCMLAPIPIPDANGKIDTTGKIDVKQGFGNYIGGIIKLVFGIIGVLAVLMIIFGGIEYMTGTSIGEKEGGISRLKNALLGLVVALGSYIILNTINPNLTDLTVTIPGVDLSPDTADTTTATTTLEYSDGTTIDVAGAQCSQNDFKIKVKVLVGDQNTYAYIDWPIKAGYPWPDDHGKNVDITDFISQHPNIFPADQWKGKQVFLAGKDERTPILTAGVTINHPNGPTKIGTGPNDPVTSLYDLPQKAVDGVIALKKSCDTTMGSPCGIEITGGTECWDHKTHGPGKEAVDLAANDSLKNYISKMKGGAQLQMGKDYQIGSTVFYYEDGAHFHVRSW